MARARADTDVRNEEQGIDLGADFAENALMPPLKNQQFPDMEQPDDAQQEEQQVSLDDI